jgi:hypothetical protein
MQTSSDPSTFKKLSLSSQVNILSFLGKQQIASIATVSKAFQKASESAINETYHIELKNLNLFIFQAEKDAPEYVRKELQAAVATHSSYKNAYQQLCQTLEVNLQSLRYRQDFINAISPEVLGTAPVISLPGIFNPFNTFSLNEEIIPTGISRSLDSDHRPAIIFRYHMTRKDGSTYEEIRIMRQRYSRHLDENIWSTVSSPDPKEPRIIESIEDGIAFGEYECYENIEMFTKLGGPFRQILTQYKKSILENTEAEPVTVKPSERLSTQSVFPVAVNLIKPGA